MTNTYAGDIRLVGGRICLDFINTVDDHTKAQPKEYLRSYADLLCWCQHAGVLEDAAREILTAEAVARPAEAAAILQRALALRTSLFRIVANLIARQPVAATDLDCLNAEIARTPPRFALGSTSDHLYWHAPSHPHALDQMLWQVVWCAADLLTSPAVAQLRICDGTGCSWVFLDTSRNQQRRWCSMDDCGNRNKTRRHYARRKAVLPPEAY